MKVFRETVFHDVSETILVHCSFKRSWFEQVAVSIRMIENHCVVGTNPPTQTQMISDDSKARKRQTVFGRGWNATARIELTDASGWKCSHSYLALFLAAAVHLIYFLIFSATTTNNRLTLAHLGLHIFLEVAPPPSDDNYLDYLFGIWLLNAQDTPRASRKLTAATWRREPQGNMEIFISLFSSRFYFRFHFSTWIQLTLFLLLVIVVTMCENRRSQKKGKGISDVRLRRL